MEIFWEIGIQTIEILTLIFGIMGMTLSLMLLFAPHLAQNLSNVLNRSINVDKSIEYLDKGIEVSEFLPSPVLSVSGFEGGSAVIACC